MSIDNKTVERVAFLSRLKVDKDKIESTKEEFNKILKWIEELNEVNTDDIEPLISVNDVNLRVRDDSVTAGNCREDVLRNAPS
ncbi:MAG: Asp-tRNA(Asn)/Glu-tRNA(Gln) amidotransferase subunit GatC, partial [Alphaproteobacteria bacterium]|nr:Asp-tRNA(Asn)/Glu-tRNA(Gln) amidotransferase subunit GatC [Alphaproteobacteria bacterium]